MPQTISQEELVNPAPELVQKLGEETVFLQRDGKTVAAIVSIDEYASTHEARAQKAIDAMWALRNHMQSVATPQELEELEKALDTHAS